MSSLVVAVYDDDVILIVTKIVQHSEWDVTSTNSHIRNSY